MSEPLPINVLPARHQQKYDGFTVVVIYDMATRKWKWTATRPVVTELRYEGIAATPSDAFGAAKRKINSR